jgi:hypothetical protein
VSASGEVGLLCGFVSGFLWSGGGRERQCVTVSMLVCLLVLTRAFDSDGAHVVGQWQHLFQLRQHLQTGMAVYMSDSGGGGGSGAKGRFSQDSAKSWGVGGGVSCGAALQHICTVHYNCVGCVL